MIRKTVLSIVLCLSAMACQHNNGDIGWLFGSWLLYSMTVDGETPADFNPEDTFWEFQNNIVDISRVGFMYEKQDRWGTWSEDDDCLLLDFNHYQLGVNPGTQHFAAPEWLGFPPRKTVRLRYLSRTSKHMSLSWVSEDGSTYIYSLRKIW